LRRTDDAPCKTRGQRGRNRQHDPDSEQAGRGEGHVPGDQAGPPGEGPSQHEDEAERDDHGDARNGHVIEPEFADAFMLSNTGHPQKANEEDYLAQRAR